eukprot:m.1197438 g.1197438  ORF g.1197438 m.1197438 type:complete len:304 (+) comp24567_c0_seq4:395-1306(+)
MRRLKRIGLPPNVVAAFERKAYHSCADVLSSPPIDISESVGVSQELALSVVNAAANAVAPKPLTVRELLEKKITEGHKQQRFLGTSLHEFDEALRGGILAGTVTEIAGPSGCGKTQFCTMMSVLAALPVAGVHDGGQVLYIDTEGAFTAERLVQMARVHCSPLVHGDEDHVGMDVLLNVVDKIRIATVGSCDALTELLNNLETTVIKSNIRLVIIDSIASLVRKEFDGGSARTRADLLSSHATTLKYRRCVQLNIFLSFGHEPVTPTAQWWGGRVLRVCIRKLAKLSYQQERCIEVQHPHHRI